MTGAEKIVAGLEAAGVTLAASVPDTWIGKLMAAVRKSGNIRAVDAREEEAVAADHTGDLHALARAAGVRHVETTEPAELGGALAAARKAPGPAVLKLPIAFDAAEMIPPYSERPAEIRTRFKL